MLDKDKFRYVYKELTENNANELGKPFVSEVFDNLNLDRRYEGYSGTNILFKLDDSSSIGIDMSKDGIIFSVYLIINKNKTDYYHINKLIDIYDSFLPTNLKYLAGTDIPQGFMLFWKKNSQIISTLELPSLGNYRIHVAEILNDSFENDGSFDFMRAFSLSQKMKEENK